MTLMKTINFLLFVAFIINIFGLILSLIVSNIPCIIFFGILSSILLYALIDVSIGIKRDTKKKEYTQLTNKVCKSLQPLHISKREIEQGVFNYMRRKKNNES